MRLRIPLLSRGLVVRHVPPAVTKQSPLHNILTEQCLGGTVWNVWSFKGETLERTCCSLDAEPRNSRAFKHAQIREVMTSRSPGPPQEPGRVSNANASSLTFQTSNIAAFLRVSSFKACRYQSKVPNNRKLIADRPECMLREPSTAPTICYAKHFRPEGKGGVIDYFSRCDSSGPIRLHT